PEGYCVTFNEDEIRAEVGLCAVIPCAFTSLFAPKHIIWYKCDTARCYYPEIIFHSDKNKENIQPGFKGRVSLVEPDVAQKNCSIIINDLKESDSGSYQLRVEGNSTKDVFTYKEKATLLVTGLNQKPSVMIPPLTEGQLVTLTCTAPGLCSGSPPNITWIHVSTLTFNSSADHHNTKITCKVSFTGNITTEETVTLNVSGRPTVKEGDYLNLTCIVNSFPLSEGDALNLTCSVDSVPPSLIMWSKNSLSMHPSNRTSSPNNTGSATLVVFNVTVGDSGRYICAATHENITETKYVDVKVTSLAGAPEATNGPKELVYANIDFSLLNRIPTKRIRSSKNKNTEYAEIKTNKEKGHQVEMMIEEDGETKNCVQEVKEEAEEPVYAKVEEPVYAKVEDLVEES
uniref:B-cell receptor CD22 n=1 Tax=Poecilia latipinna TaxID=48699 RepID=A0A3B3TYQ9_9TELE